MVTRRVSEGFGVSLLENALVFGNPKRERGTEARLIVPRSRFLMWCLVVGRTKDAIPAGTAQTPPLCRRDYTINDISTCVRSSGNCSVCSVRPTRKSQRQNSCVLNCLANAIRVLPSAPCPFRSLGTQTKIVFVSRTGAAGTETRAAPTPIRLRAGDRSIDDR